MLPEQPRRNLGGRPTIYTEARADAIVEAIELGASRKHAALCGGIAYDTLNDWRQRGLRGEVPFDEFARRCDEAEAAHINKCLRKIDSAAEEHWQAAAWKLERRYPEQYGRRIVDGQVTAHIEVSAVARRIAEDEEASRIAHELLERVAGDDADGDASRIGVRRESRALEAGASPAAAEP